MHLCPVCGLPLEANEAIGQRVLYPCGNCGWPENQMIVEVMDDADHVDGNDSGDGSAGRGRRDGDDEDARPD